jgi:hypothetical protein
MEAALLERFFSRGVPQQRIENAVDHRSTVEQQDVLRERSAVILKRLERRKAEVKRAAAEADLAAAEAAEIQAAEAARREAEEATRREAAEAGAVQDAAMSDEGTITPGAERAGVPESANDTAPEIMAPADPDTAESTEMPTGEIAFSADTEADEQRDMASGDSEGFFAETGPLREDMREANDVQPETVEFSEPDAGHDERAAEQPEEDEEVAEQLRLKAEEAKARIAKRLESLNAAGEDGPPRLDLGQDVPAIYPDEED